MTSASGNAGDNHLLEIRTDSEQVLKGHFLQVNRDTVKLHAVMIEFPAGKLDSGEASLACAQRELLEETGYTAREWARAGVLHPVISYSTEFIDIWFARGLTQGERQLDTDEFLDVFTATTAELLAWCASGQVTDAKTLTGMLWLQNVQSGAWTLDWQAAWPAVV